MDATQLTLLLTSRTQAANKLILRTEDEAAATDKAFGAMLQKHLDERADEQRRVDTERQNWRNQSTSTAPLTRVAPPAASQVASASASQAETTSSSTPAPTHAEDHAEKVTQRQSAPKDTASNAQSGQATPRKGLTQHDKTDAKSTAKSDATKADDDDTSTDAKEAAASGNVSVTKVDDNTAQSLKDGETPSDDGGKNQDGKGKEDKAQQGTDDSDGQVAVTEGIGATILGAAGQLQPAVPIGGVKSTGGTTANLPVTGQFPAQSTATGSSVPTAGGQAAGAANTTADAVTAAAQQIAAAAGALPIQGPGGSTPAAGQASDMSGTAGTLPFTGLPPTGLDSLAGENDTTFASIVGKKDDVGSGNGDGLRISITRQNQDQPLPMPKPLVRVEDSRSSTPAAQPTVAATPTTSVSPAAEEDTQGTAVAGDYQSDDADLLHGFGSFSTLVSGTGPTGTAKQADILTNLRQQLANASVQDQVAIHLQRAVRDSVDKISIQLSPEELGHIHVKMSVDDDKQVSASISVERPATLELLQRDTKALERALQEAGLKADSGSLSFSLQRGNQGDSSDTPGWGQNGRQVGSSGQEKAAAATEVSSATAGNEIDTANGLVNVAV